jgi:cytochrome c oxidase subunit 2
MSEADLMAQGEKVYKQNCVACHQATGAGMPPTFPSLHGSKVANGPAEAHITQMLKGKNLMPAFPQLSDADIAAVATYERKSWGNKGSVVQPADVAALRR